MLVTFGHVDSACIVAERLQSCGPSMSAPMIGDVQPLRFANYDLIRMLGRGGMGEVWSAVKCWQVGDQQIPIAQAMGSDPALSIDERVITKPLAVKVMHPELSADEEYREMWLGESSITMQFCSANIVSVFEVGEHDGLLYMAMERIDGVNLHEFHERVLTVGGLMPLDVTARIIHEILGALFVAHDHIVKGSPSGIIHRDVKPGNVMISSVGDVRLTDFGIARPISERSQRGYAPGTPRYMAPEQARGFASKASDLFAVGAILDELLTGRRFRDECRTTEDLLRMPFTIRPLDRQILPELDYLRRALLHPDPAQRIESARQAMSLIPNSLGQGRIKTAELYERAVGLRSSGFTRNHLAAKPSFLVQRRLGFESALTMPVLRPSAVPLERAALVAEDVPDDDDTMTYERMPWLDESSKSSHGGPETNAPLQRQVSREVGRQHRAAVPSAISKTHAGGAADGYVGTTITPTELLGPGVASSPPRAGDSPPRSPRDIERTERQPTPRFDPMHRQPAPRKTPPTAAPGPRDRHAAAGVIANSDASETSTPVQGVAPHDPPRAPTVRNPSATRVLTAVVIAAAIFAAGICTTLAMQRPSKAEAIKSETGP